ncbi:MAG: ATP-binding protein [Nitrospirota bacterium]|nr:ATP-binding protein [Nitrospirota bacterium]
MAIFKKHESKIIDPVCGMTFEEKDTVVTSSYKGTTYYFCSEKCKADFDRNPESILTMKAEREKIMEEERSETLGKMMNEVAHEIRNPLTSIGGFTRKIYDKLPEGDPNKNYMKMVIEEVARLENIVKQLVELTTIGVLHRESSNINDVIIETIKSFEQELKNNNIEVKTELIDNPPVVSIDKDKMTIAIVNLIKNAIEAMHKTPKLLKITSYIGNGHIEVIMSDTGKGIPKDKIKYIFDPFFTSKIYGPGLGLTFTQRIIQVHGGTISVESDLGKGTTFTIRLPLKELVL